MTDTTPEEQAAMAREHEVADEIVDAMLEECPGDVDVFGVAYCVWADLTHMLVSGGWSGDDLAKDVLSRAAHEESEGPVQ